MNWRTSTGFSGCAFNRLSVWIPLNSAKPSPASWRTAVKTSQSLARSVKEGRSPAVAALSGVQLDYMKRMEELLQKELPEDLHGKNHTAAIDHAEAAALYAEYAMDFATLSMRQALAAALAALLQAAENQETNEKGATQYDEVKTPKKPLIYYYGIVLLVLLLFNLLAMPWLSQRQIKEVDYARFCPW